MPGPSRNRPFRNRRRPQLTPVPRPGEPGRTSGNLLAGLPDAARAEVAEVLVRAGAARLERIVSQGQASPSNFWYDQEEHEFVMVVEGSARIAWEDGSETALGPAEWAWIPARTKHRVAWTDPAKPTVWLAVFLPADP